MALPSSHPFASRLSFFTDKLVTAPDRAHLSDAAYLRDGLLERGTPIDAIVYNRAFHAGADGEPLTGEATWPDEALTGPGAIEIIRSAARAHRARSVAENRRWAKAIERFAADNPENASSLTLPVLASEPTSLDGLAALLSRRHDSDSGYGK